MTSEMEHREVPLHPYAGGSAPSPVAEVLDQIRGMFERKNKDYATAGPWDNFVDTGHQINATPGTAVEALIAVKQSRLRQLLQPGRVAANESVEDTLLDRAVYACIALAMYRDGLYAEIPAAKPAPVANPDRTRLEDLPVKISSRVIAKNESGPAGMVANVNDYEEGSVALVRWDDGALSRVAVEDLTVLKDKS